MGTPDGDGQMIGSDPVEVPPEVPPALSAYPGSYPAGPPPLPRPGMPVIHGRSYPAPPAAPLAPDLPATPPPGHRWGLGAYLVVEVVFLGVSFLVSALFAGPDGISVPGILLALAAPTMLAAGTAVLITRLRGNGPVLDLRLDIRGKDIGIGLALGFGGLLLSIPASLVYAAVVGPEKATSAVGEIFDGVRVGWPVAVLVFLLVVVVAPICEEIVYRGLLWGAVEKLGANRWVAFLITTLLFAMAHFELTRTPLLLVVAIPIGLARVITGRLPAGVVAHAVNNLLPGLALALALTGALPAV
ncbi:MAG: CPBP family intramembrane metalloprotease [Pseudonocardia sp.]|nr:CPBP family intramembrane metalloprotease [Pseudonocardia sp.]